MPLGHLLGLKIYWQDEKRNGPMCVGLTFGDSLVTSLGRQGLPRIYEIYPGIRDRTPGQLTNQWPFNIVGRR